MIDLLSEHPYFWGSLITFWVLAACVTVQNLWREVLVHRERVRENARRQER